jgi:hypothetical protein
MGIFGDSGIFGKLFDFNGDGKVDCFEQGMELMFLNEIATEDKRKNESTFDDDLFGDFDED